MRKLFVFMMVSLDGFFEGPAHDLSWHHVDAEFNDFAVAQLHEASTILFGRRTYQLMKSFWPSEQGLQDDPEVAKLMNDMPKIVVSRTLDEVVETDHWKHIRLIKKDVAQKIQKLKADSGENIILLGSNNLLVSLMEQNLIDEFRIMINPVLIGKGTRLFTGFDKKLSLELVKSRTFTNGNILLTYSRRAS